MSDFLDMIAPQLDGMRSMYKNGYEEGRRSAFAEMKPLLDKLAAHPFLKQGGADTETGIGETNHGPQSDKA